MIVKKTFKFRLSPNSTQRELFAQFAGACRWVYNRGLAERNERWKNESKSLSLYTQNNELVTLKKEEETSWLKDMHSQILQQALADLASAFDHFFRRVKNHEVPGYPGFRCKGGSDSFRYPQGVSVKENKVYLPKIGWVKFKKSREIEGEIKQTTVILEGNNWNICFSCEIEKPEPKVELKEVVGIDLGLEHFATLASNSGIEEVSNRRFLKKELKKLKYLSRRLSKKELRSQNRLKAKIKLSRCHASTRNRRSDFLQTFYQDCQKSRCNCGRKFAGKSSSNVCS